MALFYLLSGGNQDSQNFTLMDAFSQIRQFKRSGHVSSSGGRNYF
jgi:hypothetical protein